MFGGNSSLFYYTLGLLSAGLPDAQETDWEAATALKLFDLGNLEMNRNWSRKSVVAAISDRKSVSPELLALQPSLDYIDAKNIVELGEKCESFVREFEEALRQDHEANLSLNMSKIFGSSVIYGRRKE